MFRTTTREGSVRSSAADSLTELMPTDMAESTPRSSRSSEASRPSMPVACAVVFRNK